MVRFWVSLVVVVSFFTMIIGQVFAESPGPPEASGAKISATSKCQADGTLQVTWKVHNPWDETISITKSSKPAVVAVGTLISAKSEKDFIENIGSPQPEYSSLQLNAKRQNTGVEYTMLTPFALSQCQRSAAQTLPDTGSSGILALFVITSVLGAGTHYLLSHRRLN